MFAVALTRYGGVEGLKVVDAPDPEVGPDHVLIDVTRAGVNYADVHRRLGTYDVQGELPRVIGAEVAGRRADTGARVVAFTGGTGGYAQRAAVREDLAFPIPDELDDDRALALLMAGLTAWHVVRSCARLAEGEAIVVHAAAGGVGSIAVQLARIWGAGRVIAVASTAEKRELALGLGAHEAVEAEPAGLTERLLAANAGRPVDAVLEMVGGETFDASLRALAPLGRLVTFGSVGDEDRQVSADELGERCVGVIGFWIRPLFERRELLAEPLRELFALAVDGRLTPRIGAVYPLADVGRAHLELEGRLSTGKLLLDVTAV